jgi:hypothetical protein
MIKKMEKVFCVLIFYELFNKLNEHAKIGKLVQRDGDDYNGFL